MQYRHFIFQNTKALFKNVSLGKPILIQFRHGVPRNSPVQKINTNKHVRKQYFPKALGVESSILKSPSKNSLVYYRLF